MKNAFTKGWYVLYVRSRHEKKVHELLLESSLESFLPLIKKERKWSDRKKIIHEPLFPSYVFVYLRNSMDLYRALSVNGACAYIRFGNEYAKVSSEEIKKVKLLIGADGLVDFELNSALPKVGDALEITDGPLSGLNCEVMRVNNENKIVVRIDSIRQNIIATLPLFYLSEISKAV